MASEALRLSLLLELKDNASGGVRSFVSDLKALDKQGNLTLKTLEKIRKEFNKKIKFGGVSGTDQSLRDLKKLDDQADKTRSKLGKKFKFGGLTGTGQSIRDLKKVEDQSAQTLKGLNRVKSGLNAGSRKGGQPASGIPGIDDTPLPPRTPYRDPRRRRDPIAEPYSMPERIANSYDRYIDPAMQMKSSIHGEVSDLKRYTDETLKLYRAQAQFRSLNLPKEQTKKVFDAVTGYVNKEHLTTLADGTQMAIDLYGALGNVDAAVKALPIASKYRFSMKGIFGDDDKALDEQVQNTFKYLELIGKTSDQGEMERAFNVMTKITSSTGGRVTGRDFLQFAKRGGAAATQLSEGGMRTVGTMFEEMGSSEVGTSLMSMYQALVGGVMTQRARNRFNDFGLLDESKIEVNPLTGAVKSMQPGANKLAYPMMEDPLKAADMLAESMKAKGIDTTNAKAVGEELAVLFQNRNAQKMMSSLILNRDNVAKERDRASSANGIDENLNITTESGLAKLLKFENAFVDFKTRAGVPMLEAATGITQGLMPLMQLMADYPTVTRYTAEALLLAKGLKLVGEGFSVFRSAGSLVSGLSGNLRGASAEAGTLRGRLTSMPSLVSIGVSLAAIGFTWEMIQWLRDTAAKQTEQRMANSSVNKQATDIREMQKSEASKYASPEQQRQHYRSLGMSEASINLAMPNARRDATDLRTNLSEGKNNALVKQIDPSQRGLADILPNLGKILTLQRTEFQTTGPMPADIAEKRGAREKFYEKQGPRNENRWTDYAAAALVPALAPTLLMGMTGSKALTDRELQGASYFREQAPQLRDPEVMRAFRTQEIPKMGLDQQGQTDLNNMLKLAFPESFAASANASAESLTAFASNLTSMNDPMVQTGGTFLALAPTVQPLPQQFSDLGEPLNNTRSSLTDVNNAAQPLPGQLSNVNTSLSNVSSSLNGLSVSISSWRPPASPAAAVPGVAGFAPSGFANPMKPSGFAVGGELTHSGIAIVHAKEQIVPAKAVAFRDRTSQSMVSTTSELREMVERFNTVGGAGVETSLFQKSDSERGPFSMFSRNTVQVGAPAIANYLPSSFEKDPDGTVAGFSGKRTEKDGTSGNFANEKRAQAGKASPVIQITYSPQVTVHTSGSDGGGQPDIARQIEEALDQHYERTFPRIVRDLTKQIDNERRWA